MQRLIINLWPRLKSSIGACHLGGPRPHFSWKFSCFAALFAPARLIFLPSRDRPVLHHRTEPSCQMNNSPAPRSCAPGANLRPGSANHATERNRFYALKRLIFTSTAIYRPRVIYHWWNRKRANHDMQRVTTPLIVIYYCRSVINSSRYAPTLNYLYYDSALYAQK